MEKGRLHRAIALTAQNHGVSYDEVYGEMKLAIGEAMRSADQRQQQYWESIPKVSDKPSPEEVIEYILHLLGEEKAAG